MFLLNGYEILLLQETPQPESRSGILDGFDDGFVTVTVFIPAIRKDDILVGRSSGGLAFFWKKN